MRMSYDKPENKKNSRIFLVRHGQPEQHSGKIFLGQANVPLSELGRKEAEAAGLRLIELGVRPKLIYTSDLVRAKETADIIAEKFGGIPVRPDILFREMAMGSWDGELIEDIKKKFPEEYAKRGDDLRNYRTPGGENFYDLHSRVIREFHRIFKEDFRDSEEDIGDLVIVAHMGVNVALAEEIRQTPYFGVPGISFSTGSVTEYETPEWMWDENSTVIKIDILTLFPEMFDNVLSAGVIGKAAKRNLLDFRVINIRDHSEDKHLKTDDYPFGGGAGQLMTAQPIFAALRSLGIEPNSNNSAEIRRMIYLSPRGRKLDKELAEELSKEDKIVLLCGHYEGVDQRVLEAFDFEEVSIGDYILTGGELPAMVLIDAVCRLIPGVLGSGDSHAEESIYSGLLEYPQYTRPASYEGSDVPDVLTSGDHVKIALWNFEQSLRVTAERRPELLQSWLLDNYENLDKERKKIASVYYEIYREKLYLAGSIRDILKRAEDKEQEK